MKKTTKKETDGAALSRALAAARLETAASAALATAARWGVFVAASGVLAASVGRLGAGNWEKSGVWGLWSVWFAANIGGGLFLARRFRRQYPTSTQTARRLERRFAELAGILTAAEEFAKDGERENETTSAELRAATIRTAIRRTDEIWRGLDAAERLGVVWNVDGATTRRRTAVEFCVAGILGAAALGVGMDGVWESIGRIAKIEEIKRKEKAGKTTESFVEFWKKIEEENKNELKNEKISGVLVKDEIIDKKNEISLETSAEIASFVDDLTRAGGVASNFAEDLRRQTATKETPFDWEPLSATREIGSLIAAPGKGLRDRAARLERAATAALEESTLNEQGGQYAQIGAFVASATAVRAREFGATLANETPSGSFAALGAAIRNGDSGERARAFEAAIRSAERFAETARREKAAWSALAASWAFASRRREFETNVDALFDATRTALTRAPGRSAFELAGANENVAEIERNAASLRETIGGAFDDFERLRDSLTRDDAAEFLAFVERLARRNAAQTPIGVEKSALDWIATQTAACDRIASTAADGRFGAASTLVDKLTFGTLDGAADETPENAESDAEKRRRRAALAAARLTFGFGKSANDGEFNGSEDLRKRPTTAESWEKSAVRKENVDGANAENGGDFADELAANGEPTSFDDLRELAAATIRELDGDAVSTVNRENGGSDSGIAGGNAPDAAFSGGKARLDVAPRSEISAFDAFWNELPDVEKERLGEALKTETPSEFDEKIRLYRRRLFDGDF